MLDNVWQDYNCTVEFVRSHFLVREGVRANAQGNTNPTLSIDRIDKSNGRWKRANILVFNTGHWWVHGKTARGYASFPFCLLTLLRVCWQFCYLIRFFYLVPQIIVSKCGLNLSEPVVLAKRCKIFWVDHLKAWCCWCIPLYLCYFVSCHNFSREGRATSNVEWLGK